MMTDLPYVLALDISSSHIGYCLYHGAVLDHAEWTLQGDIAERCRLAYNRFYSLLERYPQIDVVAYEAAVGRYFTACETECNVQGAILALAGQRHIPVVKISPAAAKKELTGRGNASKTEVQKFAADYGVQGEHAADSLGVALAAVKRIEVVAG